MANTVITSPAFTDEVEMNTINKFSWTNLLPELLQYICKYFGGSDLKQIRLVSKLWYDTTRCLFLQKFKLIITHFNVVTIRDILQENGEFSHRLKYKNVEIHDVEKTDDLHSILKSLGPNIRTLHIRKSHILAILNDYVPQLEELCINHISTESIKDLGAFDFGKIKNLKSLDIRYKLTSDFINNIMQKLTLEESTIKLERIGMSVSFTAEKTILHILQCHKESLKHLRLRFPRCPQNILEWSQVMAMCKRLEVLEISRNFNTEWLRNILNALPKETPLQHFILDQFLELDLSKFIIDKWPRLLIYINLGYRYTECNEDIKNLIVLRHNLRYFMVESANAVPVNSLLQGIASEKNNVLKVLMCGNLNSTLRDTYNIQILLQRLPNLTYLSFEHSATCIDDNVLSCIFRYLLNLKYLNFNYCTQITDNGLLGFGPNPAPITNLRRLQSLSLNHCKQITNRSFIKCLKFIELRKLDCDFCHQISSNGIKAMVTNCPALEEISLSACSLINDCSVLYITQGLHRLKKLNIDGCTKLTGEFINHIVEYCKCLKVLEMDGLGHLYNKKNCEKLADRGIHTSCDECILTL